MTAKSFSLGAYRRADPDSDYLKRNGLPICRLDETIRWVLGKGYDSILIDLHETKPHDCCDADCES